MGFFTHVCIFRDKLVRLFKIAEENNNSEELPISPFEGHTYAINHVEFSRDGDMLASCSLDGSTIIWDPTVSCSKNSSLKISNNKIGLLIFR